MCFLPARDPVTGLNVKIPRTNIVNTIMSSFHRRNHDGQEGYFINPHLSLPIPSSHGENHDFETAPYHFPQHQVNSYASHFSLPYSHTAISAHHTQGPTIAPVPDHALHHLPSQYISQARYLQAPAYLSLHETLAETELESQESMNGESMLSEPLVPPLEGFPNIKEFDGIVRR